MNYCQKNQKLFKFHNLLDLCRFFVNIIQPGIGGSFHLQIPESANELHDAMKGEDFFNHDDIQSDYFHRSHYVDINVGKWDQPYVHAS